jgi:hypothetical protein
MIDNQVYDSILPEYGLTAQQLVMFHMCGLEPPTVSSLRSLFTSLDKDGGGELGPDEVYQALTSAGQKVTRHFFPFTPSSRQNVSSLNTNQVVKETECESWPSHEGLFRESASDTAWWGSNWATFEKRG